MSLEGGSEAKAALPARLFYCARGMRARLGVKVPCGG